MRPIKVTQKKKPKNPVLVIKKKKKQVLRQRSNCEATQYKILELVLPLLSVPNLPAYRFSAEAETKRCQCRTEALSVSRKLNLADYVISTAFICQIFFTKVLLLYSWVYDEQLFFIHRSEERSKSKNLIPVQATNICLTKVSRQTKTFTVILHQILTILLATV